MDFQVAGIQWCRCPDVGLPAPDVVFYLSLSPEAAQQRSMYGNERYEKAEFQAKVERQFGEMKDERWREVDAGRPMETIHREILEIAMTVIEESSSKEIEPLWQNEK